ncbi:MAG TPA: DUF4159 domain-containing protein [Candidatus Brocadiia bacterium]|nr:DUF4159 domain-containing protein [Candidatus Brocadiia bacterium]
MWKSRLTDATEKGHPSISRRAFLTAAAAGIVGIRSARAANPSRFIFAQVKYSGGNWTPYSGVGAALLSQIEKRTSVEVDLEPKIVEITRADLSRHPFLYMAGDAEFDPFTDEQTALLRRFCSFGGLILLDNVASDERSGFDKSVRREFARVFPNRPFRELSPEHAVYRSFYRLHRFAGRVAVVPLLEGVEVEAFTPVIYSRCDLGGAWAQDRMGFWTNTPIPGGEAQRRESMRAGVNIVMYALTSDYKLDQVHIEYLRRSGRWP